MKPTTPESEARRADNVLRLGRATVTARPTPKPDAGAPGQAGALDGRRADAGLPDVGARAEPSGPAKPACTRPPWSSAAGALDAPLLTVKQAAAMIQVSRASFWSLHSAGRVPLPIRLSPRVVRWRRSELDAWILAGCPGRGDWQKIWKKTLDSLQA